MAGPLAVVMVESEQIDKALSSIKDHWKISFARFIHFPTLPSNSSSLVHPADNKRYRLNPGTWISSDLLTASLQLFDYQSSSDAILTVNLNGKIFEEHYVTDLHYFWPQLSCVPGYPGRGSKTVFVSYRHSIGEIQKFALQFLTFTEAEEFINVLKDIFNNSTETQPLIGDFRSEVSSQSVFTPSIMAQSRSSVEEVNNIIPVEDYSPLPPPSLNYEIEQESQKKESELNQNSQGISPAMPPSFTSLISDCRHEVKKAAVQPSFKEEFDIKSQIAKYMEDSSFQDMLMKVEKVISEIGGELML